MQALFMHALRAIRRFAFARCACLFLVLLSLTAVGCRNGWPFQTAQSPPKSESKVAKDEASSPGEEPPADAVVAASAVALTGQDRSSRTNSDSAVIQASHHEETSDSDSPARLPGVASLAGQLDKSNTKGGDSTTALPTPSKVTNYPAALASEAWVLSPILPNAKPDEVQYTWRHAGLAPVFAQKPEDRADLLPLLNDTKPIVAANAAIVIARWGGPQSAQAVPRLTATARETELKMALRGASIEALLTVPSQAALGDTRNLIDELGDATGKQKASFTPELHAALLKVLIRHVSVDGDPRFAAALKSPSADVRLEAIRSYRTSLAIHSGQKHAPLPKAALLLSEDGDPRVRIAALGTLAEYHDPRALDAIKRGLDDYELPVRLAAIAALGILGGDSSREALEKLKQHPSELKRAAVINSLAAMGAHDAVLDAAQDKSVHVRQAVAQALGTVPAAARQLRKQSTSLARDLLHDASGEVQRRTVKAIADWPLEEAGPVLLTAIDEGGYLARREAAEYLAELWPEAEGFPVSASNEKRAAAMAELRSKWIEQFGSPDGGLAQSAITRAEQRLGIARERVAQLQRLLDPLKAAGLPADDRRRAVEAIKQFGPDLLLALEQLAAEQNGSVPAEVYRDVLPELGPAFAALEQLSSSKTPERRAAAEKLVAQAAGKQLSPLVVARLAEVLASESDPGVWQSVLAATANDPGADALQIARMAIGNPTVEVRRRACEYLSLHGSIDNTPLLLPLLADPNTAIVIAAVRALAAAGAIDDSAPLVELLASPDKHVRIEVAITLGKLRCREGVPALERMSHENEWQIRQRAVTALGDCGDQSSVPLLMEMLDDRIEVQLAAMRSLSKLVGDDQGRPSGNSPPPSEQARLWKRWFRTQDASDSTQTQIKVRYEEPDESER